MKLRNYICGEWREGEGRGTALRNPVNGEILAHAGSDGVDLEGALAYARRVGNPAWIAWRGTRHSSPCTS